MAAKKQGRCLIVCASPEADVDFLKSLVRDDDFIICADAGYTYAKQAGIRPDLLVGDFDSYGGELPDDVEVVRLNVRKDYSDTHVAATLAVDKGFTEILLVFAVGGRLDHTLSNLCVLSYLTENGVSAYAVSSAVRVYMISAFAVTVPDCLDKTFSLFSYNGSARASVAGDVEYPVENTLFSVDVSLGLSNVSHSETLTVQALEGTLILIINDNESF